MAEAAVTHDVEHDVALERLAVVVGQARRAHARLGVVAVHVEDRRLDHLGDVGRVETRARRLRRGREADLVVDHDVDRAADVIARELTHVERLGDDALAGEGRVAVDQDREVGVELDHRVDAGPVARTDHDVLLGAHDALDDGRDRFEVRGVRRHRDVDGRAARVLELAARALVVLDVTTPLDALGVQVPLELREDVVVGLADDVGQAR